MNFSWQLFVFSLTISFLLNLTVAQQQPLYNICDNSNGNFTRNSTYEANLNSLLSSFSSNTANDYGFYNLISGQGSDRANAISLCRGDVNSGDCISCINNATAELKSRCLNQKEAIIWYDYCMFRYTNRSILGVADSNPAYLMWSPSNFTDGEDLNNALLSSLLGALINTAASGTSSLKLAAGPASVNVRHIEFQPLYALVQCTPDLTEVDCSSCLSLAVDFIPKFFDRKRGGRVIGPSCILRFEKYMFYNETAIASSPPPIQAPSPSPPSSNDTRSSTGRGSNKTLIVIIVVASVVGVLILISSIYIFRRAKKTRELVGKHIDHNSQEFQLLELRGSVGDDYSNENFQREGGVRSKEFPSIQLNILQVATKQFCDENKIGEGGFGLVYKGKLADGKEIAIKRLSRTSGQGLLEFKNEVILIAKLQHRNLVRLLGCCLERNEKLLVYEYMPNKSLDVFLFDSSIGVQLDWQKRLSIINGIARGILYLHEDSRLRIIHRDLKASNVLLDHEMNPKISDFGMARIFGGNQSEANTKRVVGTYGYMAPEYAMEGFFSIKSDVFSFGVLLLEIVSGKRNNGFHLSERGESLLTFAWKLWSKGRGMELIDPRIDQSFVATEVLKCINIGLLCVQEDPADRPTMSSVVVMLGSETITLPQPTEPAFSIGRVVAEPTQHTPNDGLCSVNEVTVSNISPR
ncbi:hypothetical protein DITRI_Ditri03aG0045400 [Diplodiscus trichospermus]